MLAAGLGEIAADALGARGSRACNRRNRPSARSARAEVGIHHADILRMAVAAPVADIKIVAGGFLRAPWPPELGRLSLIVMAGRMMAMMTEHQKTIRPPITTSAGVIFMVWHPPSGIAVLQRFPALHGQDRVAESDHRAGDDEQASSARSIMNIAICGRVL